MLHPIGYRSPAVYWRRRLMVFGALSAMVGLSAWVLRPGTDNGSAAPAPSHSRLSSSAADAHPSTTGTVHHPHRSSTSASRSHQVTPRCSPAQLKVAAVVAQPSYQVGQQPMVLLQVTNVGTRSCVQNLADSQVELRVYNGESRVWSSHDCSVQPGVDNRILAPGRPVRVGVTWSGLSSQPKCAGTRQRVGAGTYTLYASLAGREGAAAQFSIR
jgi:hypothetical protein